MLKELKEQLMELPVHAPLRFVSGHCSAAHLYCFGLPVHTFPYLTSTQPLGQLGEFHFVFLGKVVRNFSYDDFEPIAYIHRCFF